MGCRGHRLIVTTAMPRPGSLPVRPTCRVIVDNDWTGDPDGLVGLAHHLLSPSNEVVLVTSSRLADMFVHDRGSPAHGADLAAEVVALSGAAAPRIAAGSPTWFADGASSDAADAIVEVARSQPQGSDTPLLLVCAGPLTNVAQALAQDPGISALLTLVWVGGALDGGFEYNRDTDPAAAEFVFARPDLQIVQFPVEAYRQVACSVAELEWELGHATGELGERLWQAFLDLPLPDFVRLGGTWALGDSCPLLLTALSGDSSEARDAVHPGVAARRTVYTRVDGRLIVADFLAKLRLQASGSV